MCPRDESSDGFRTQLFFFVSFFKRASVFRHLGEQQQLQQQKQSTHYQSARRSARRVKAASITGRRVQLASLERGWETKWRAVNSPVSKKKTKNTITYTHSEKASGWRAESRNISTRRLVSCAAPMCSCEIWRFSGEKNTYRHTSTLNAFMASWMHCL